MPRNGGHMSDMIKFNSDRDIVTEHNNEIIRWRWIFKEQPERICFHIKRSLQSYWIQKNDCCSG